jgi:hypothetical protein
MDVVTHAGFSGLEATSAVDLTGPEPTNVRPRRGPVDTLIPMAAS